MLYNHHHYLAPEQHDIFMAYNTAVFITFGIGGNQVYHKYNLDFKKYIGTNQATKLLTKCKQSYYFYATNLLNCTLKRHHCKKIVQGKIILVGAPSCLMTLVLAIQVYMLRFTCLQLYKSMEDNYFAAKGKRMYSKPAPRRWRGPWTQINSSCVLVSFSILQQGREGREHNGQKCIQACPILS